MNPNYRLYSIVILFAGISTSFIFLLFQNAVHIMYESPGEASDFNRFIFPIALLAITPGLFIKAKSLTNKILVTGGTLLLLATVLSVVTGLTFGYASKTETFLLYFLSCGLTFIVLAFTVALLLRLLLYSQALDGQGTLKLAAIFTAGIAMGYLVFMGVGTLNTVSVFALWYLVLILIGFAFFIARKEQPLAAG
ncbi:membrane hypothetical protein [Imperialibacter sp. EC-SDR9]|nr:membrane hypothetical protein [Imperialibacter sp. 89]CAD5265745.1 membrane hypothetical protein [Imperialibacter sp. 75]VVT21435.1 membrane hypothetical protein [Imperialibacter sp. EC-SDR9]